MRKPDFAERYTDKDFAEYEKRIRKVYEQAEKEIGEKLADFTEKHKARDIKMRELVEAGKMTEADYKSWMQGQVFQGKQWRAKQQQMAETLYNANTIAQRMANGNLPKVFAMNANYMSYTAEKAAGYRIGFTMYDSATVANLIKNDPKILPFKKLNKEKDIRWNFKNIKGEVTQGIIQGESVNEIAARLQKEMPNRSYKMCRVHARTMYTSAQNAGRMESMKMHQQMGIKNKKQWIATLDERTRWMHRDLDGQVRDLEEPFEIGQYSIMYPGDPFAHPSMVYNCRCSLGEVVDKYPDTYERRDNITKEVIQNMTYNEWAEMNGVSNPRPNGMKPVMPKKTATAEKFAIPATVKKLVSRQTASDDWFEYEYQDLMHKYIETGEMPKKDMNEREIELEERQKIAAEAEIIQELGAKTKTQYRTLYRGMVLEESDVRAMFTPGEEYIFPTLSATTPEKGIAGIYMDSENAGFGVPVIMEIQKPDGIYGFKRDDIETIIPKGSTFKVVRNYMDKDGVVHISLYAKKGKNVR